MTRKRFLSIVFAITILALIIMAEEHAGLLKVGDSAPAFTATLSNGESMTLSQYRGAKNVVLFFYPKDFSSGCTKQVCSYRDNYSQLEKFDAVMFGVSYDEADSHRSFVRAHGLPFPLISDGDKSLSRAYGAARLGGLLPMVKRVTYIIDKQGVIRGVAHHEYAIGRHIEDVLEALKGLDH